MNLTALPRKGVRSVGSPTRTRTQADLETPREAWGLLGPIRSDFRPHISTTPRDETDTDLYEFLNANDMRYDTDRLQTLGLLTVPSSPVRNQRMPPTRVGYPNPLVPALLR
jgi:hypothetical protein